MGQGDLPKRVSRRTKNGRFVGYQWRFTENVAGEKKDRRSSLGADFGEACRLAEELNLAMDGEVVPTARPEMTFKEFTVECWIPNRLSGRNEKNRKLVTQRMQTHVYPTFGEMPIGTVWVDDLDRMVSTMRRTLSPQTCNHISKDVGSVFRYARKLRTIPESPYYPEDHLLQVDEALPNPLTPKQIKALEEAVETLPHHAVKFWLCRYTGMRWGSARNLKWDRVNLSNREVGLEKPKSGKSFWTMIEPELSAILRAEFKRQMNEGMSEHVLVSRPPNPQAWTKTLARKVGFHWTCHQLRHSRTCELLGSGMHPTHIAQIMGWANVNMVYRYGTVSKPWLRREFDEAAARRANSEPVSGALREES